MSRFFLNLFIVNILIDPVNSLLNIKIITFFLCIITNIKKVYISFERLSIFIVFYIIFFISTAFMLFRNINYDIDFLKTYSTTFLTLAIFFIDPLKINIIPGLKIATIFITCSTNFFSILAYFFPEVKILFLLDNGLGGIFRSIENKHIFNWTIIGIYHRASAILVFPFALMWCSFLKKQKIKYMIYTIMIGLALFFSGTRANIFSVILIIFLIYTYYIFFKKRMLQTVFLLCFSGFLIVIGTFLFITVKNDSSLVKDGHLFSYIDLFRNNIIYLLIGQGPGSYFYTKGYNMEATNTELSYLELIRMFGLFSSVIIMFYYILPFLKIKNYNKNYSFVVAIAYLAYLFIAGTNPLLIGPTGFMAIWIAYTLLSQINAVSNKII